MSASPRALFALNNVSVSLSLRVSQVLSQFTEMTGRYTKEMQSVGSITPRLRCDLNLPVLVGCSAYLVELLQIDALLKERDAIHASYTAIQPLKRSSSNKATKASSRGEGEPQAREKKPAARERPKKKKWYNAHFKVEKRKPC